MVPSTPGSTTGISRSDTAMMNLYQHFSDLQTTIETVRQERDTLQKALEECRERAASLEQQLRDDERAQQEAACKIENWHPRIETLQHQYEAILQKSYDEAISGRERASQKLDQWKEYKLTGYLSFLEESRDFRRTCKRLRLSAATLGLHHSSIGAAVYALSARENNQHTSKGIEGAISLFDELDNNVLTNTQMVQVNTSEAFGCDKDFTSLLEIPASDDDIISLIESHRTKKNELQSHKDQLKQLQIHKHELINKQSERSDRLTLLQNQFDRIAKENHELEARITDLEVLTAEAKSMANRRSRGSTSHPIVQTQEFRINHLTPKNVPRHPARPGKTIVSVRKNSISKNPYRRSPSYSSERIFPTSAACGMGLPAPPRPCIEESNSSNRRIRRDKQFGSKLEILGGHDVGRASRNDNVALVDSPVSKGGTMSDLSALILEEDDETEDDLLSFVAFSK